MPAIVEAEIRHLSGLHSRSPLTLPIPHEATCRRAKDVGAQNLLLSLHREQRLSRGAVHRHPAAVSSLVLRDVKGGRREVHMLPLERPQFASAHAGVKGEGDEGAEAIW